MTGTLLLFCRIALRNVRRNLRRSLYAVVAVSFGLFCLIVFQALKVGLHEEMTASTVRLETGNLRITPREYEPGLHSLRPLPDPARVTAALASLELNRHAPRLRVAALLMSRGKTASVSLTGIDHRREPLVTQLRSRTVSGRFDGEGILLGADLARSLGVGAGGELSLMAQGSGAFPVTRRLPVTGLYRTELASFDRSRIYLPLPLLLDLLGAEGAGEIAVATPFEREEEALRALRPLLPGHRVESWREIVPDLAQLIELNDATMRLLVGILFALAALGIAGTMSMSVHERFREIGVLGAIGTTPGGILLMVALESLLIGALASAIGTLSGIACSLYLAHHGVDLSHFTGSNQYIAMSHILKARLLFADVVAANAVSLATALLAGLYPAWKGARLEPVRALRSA